MVFEYDNFGAPIGVVYNGTQYFYNTNQFGDVVGILDENGIEIAEYDYEEWGEIHQTYYTNPNDENTEHYDFIDINPLLYRGYYYDYETGYYYLQSRYYDPSICRFINADIPEIAQQSKDEVNGLNLFAYCCNDPVNNEDSTGYSSSKILYNKFYKKGISVSVVGNMVKNMNVTKSCSKMSKQDIYIAHQYYYRSKFYGRESYDMYTYAATKSQWKKLMDKFDKALTLYDIATGTTIANMAGSKVKNLLKKRFKILTRNSLSGFLNYIGITFDFLLFVFQGIIKKINKSIENIKKNDYYIFNMYTLYQSTYFGGGNKIVYDEYVTGISTLVLNL